jgi:hypothetical protein
VVAFRKLGLSIWQVYTNATRHVLDQSDICPTQGWYRTTDVTRWLDTGKDREAGFIRRGSRFDAQSRVSLHQGAVDRAVDR